VNFTEDIINDFLKYMLQNTHNITLLHYLQISTLLIRILT